MTKTMAAALAVVLMTASSANGQGTLGDALSFLMTNQAVQTGDFARDRAAADAARDAVTRALLVNLTTAPIGTSSGGFLYRLNPELGTVERVSDNFGTFFVERALTGGAGSTSFGITTATAAYDRLNGFDLHDGSFITVANQLRSEATPFDTESLTMNLRASTLSFWANVGVTDDVELGVVVPMARISLDGERLNVYRGAPFLQAAASGTASGLSDIALRAKYGFFHSRSTTLAAAGEVRLPTGDESNLLGAGSTSVRILGVASFEHGPLGLHANGGIVRGGVSDETILAGALAVAIHSRATLTMEVLRRHVSELRGFEPTVVPHATVSNVDTTRVTTGLETTTLIAASTGVKWNVADTVVLTTQVLWALADRGLTAPVTPIIALEYSIR